MPGESTWHICFPQVENTLPLHFKYEVSISFKYQIRSSIIVAQQEKHISGMYKPFKG